MTTTVQTLILIGSLGGMMWAMLKFMLRDIHKDLTEIKEASKRHEARIDHLYELCVEMLRTKR
jgi:hypothetical protein